MKIYKIQICMVSVIARLKTYELGNYNSSTPVVFVEANDPDGACYRATHDLAKILLKKDHSIDSINFIKEIMHDVRIIKIECPNEKEL
jgi:hypothetical protein